MDFFASLAEKLSSLLTSQPFINGVHAVFGGLVGAFAFSRTHPIKLVVSAVLAFLFGLMWGGAACEIVLEVCNMKTFKAFSFAIGILSWPIFLLIPKIPDAVISLYAKWVKK